QQAQWQTCVSTGPSATGWGGRTADKLDSAMNFPMMVTSAGLTPFTAADVSRPLAVTPGQAFQLNGFTGTTAPSRYAALQTLLPTHLDKHLFASASHPLPSAFAKSHLRGPPPAVQTTFPTTGLGNQLKQVAQLIKLNQSKLGLPRQLFFCSLGGFDTHSQQANAQAGLLTQLSNALAAFDAATIELGVSSAVPTIHLCSFLSAC